jgi:polysaccharide pyruvyl transferase WcaK-like protein
MKTLLVGNFGARNVGDEMILASALERYPDAIVATADAEFSIRFQEKKFQTVLPFPTGLRSWIRFLSHPEGTMRELKGTVDTIVFPGGGLLAIKDKAWWIWGSTIVGLHKLFPSARIILEAQGIDTPKNDWQKFWLNRVIDSVHSISVRDKESAEVIFSFGSSAEVVGDAAENFLEQGFEGKVSIFSLQSSKKELVLVNARAKFHGEWPKADIFLAMEPGDAKWCPENFSGKILFPDTVLEAIALFNSAKVVIGQRLHFLIMAKACGCPEVKTLGEPYAEKVKNWLKRKG